jgi:hypothetical protein
VVEFKMKKILIGLSLIISSVTVACPSLDGKWLSSLEKFDQFNKRWANVDSKAWSFMLQTQGHELIEYKSSKEMVISSPEIEIKIGDKKMMRPSSEEHMNFNVLGCTENNIVLKYEQNDKVQISTLYFENKDTYWVYMGKVGSDGNSHIREYYMRNK